MRILITAAIIQARMGSTRLPGKVVKDLCGKPVLWHVIHRVQQASLPNITLVATTTNPEDDVIESFCHAWDIPVFRGEENDVLRRFCGSVAFLEKSYGPIEYIVRVTADCPLIDPQVIDSVVAEMLSGNYDYVSNVDPPTFPDGLDVEVITRDVLLEADEKAMLPSDREHVTPFIRMNPVIRKTTIRNPEDLSHLRWTLDTQEDYTFISEIYGDLHCPPEIFLMTDILNLLARKPELQKINSHISRNQGYEKSLSQDHTR
ncbi:MAG: 8-amino-3,8-dideoxy-manno-octulosonate cytidylyltransferase [Methanoregula sp. SKADARSKE-2]|nr:MAG: 8-amino-3,8-dideoxy-manno-octulosonate cytidylyltransferase [Methanoregula sp. SKADARSKE-2]